MGVLTSELLQKKVYLLNFDEFQKLMFSYYVVSVKIKRYSFVYTVSFCFSKFG